MREGRGVTRDSTGTLVTDFDTVAIDHYSSIVEEVTNLAPDLFEEPSQAVQKALDDGDQAGYRRALDRLIGQIQASTDLIEVDKDRLVPGYVSLFEKRARQRLRSLDQVSGTRGKGSELALLASAEGKELSNSIL